MSQEPVLPLWELVRTAHLAARRLTEVFAREGLSPAQFGVLACLADGDDLSTAELARAVLVRPQSMGRLVEAMVRQGLVERVGPGGRGRRTGLVLTTAGRQAHDRVRPIAYAVQQPPEIGLEAEQADALLGLLARVHDRLARDPAGG